MILNPENVTRCKKCELPKQTMGVTLPKYKLAKGLWLKTIDLMIMMVMMTMMMVTVMMMMMTMMTMTTMMLTTTTMMIKSTRGWAWAGINTRDPDVPAMPGIPGSEG